MYNMQCIAAREVYLRWRAEANWEYNGFIETSHNAGNFENAQELSQTPHANAFHAEEPGEKE